MTKPLISSNWKSLAAFAKAGKKAADLKDVTLTTEVVKNTSSGEMKKNIWFEVDEQSLKRSEIEVKRATSVDGNTSIPDLFPPAPSKHAEETGKYIAMDCEMVGVGPDGTQSVLARVSLVNYHGHVVLDTFVKPVEKITDYRTHVSGVEPHHLVAAPSLPEVQKTVCEILKGKILVGHALRNDYRALLLEHPRTMTRDTSKYRPFRRLTKGKNPGLKRLAQQILGIEIQKGAHDSVDDARVTMLLYRSQKTEWENYLFRGEGRVVKKKQRARKEKRKSYIKRKEK